MYQAKLLKLDDYIEEEVILEINGIEIVGFTSVCPYKLTPNKVYLVDLSLTFLEDSEMIEQCEERYGLEKIDEAYGYMLYGQVCGNAIDIGNGIKIQDNIFSENSYLNGHYIKIKADRLSIKFI